MRVPMLLLLLLPGLASAATTTLPIPGQGWQVSFESPVLTKLEESNQPAQYMYAGYADRFSVSVYVETPGCSGGATHRAFHDCFWPRARRNPTIVKSSVVATEHPGYYKVAYDVEAPVQGRTLRQRNVNYLIAYRGKWTDLHVSVIEPTAEDLAMLDALEKSLAYGEVAAATPATGATPVAAPATGRPSFEDVKAKGDEQEDALGSSMGVYYMALGRKTLPAMMACRQSAKTGPDPGFTVVLEVDASGKIVDTWQQGESPIGACFRQKMTGEFLFVPPQVPFYSVHEILPTP
jgi:hypothetical protein